jgi:hypothetical protein
MSTERMRSERMRSDRREDESSRGCDERLCDYEKIIFAIERLLSCSGCIANARL